MNRAEYRRKQRQDAKADSRVYVTQREMEIMVEREVQRRTKSLIEEYNAEYVQRDAEIKNDLLQLMHAIWLHALGEYGITDRELTFNLDQYVKRMFKKFSDYIDMGEDDHARELLAEIGVPASIVGLAEKHFRADPAEDIIIDLEE